MIPILMQDETTVGFLKEAMSCVVTEERNGVFELTLTYPVTGALFDKLQIDRFVKAKPNDTADLQLFRIYEVSKPMNGVVTVNAEHVSYALSNFPASSVRITGTATQAINAVLSEVSYDLDYFEKTNPFMVATTDMDAVKTFEFKVGSARAALGGTEGSILDVFGGEYEFDNYTIRLHKNRGRDTGIVIAYGKNMTDIKVTTSLESAYTALYPYAIKDDVLYVANVWEYDTEPTLTFIEYDPIMPVQNRSGIADRILIRDFTNDFVKDETVTNRTLAEKAEKWLQQNDINSPSVNVTVSFVQLWESSEYEELKALEQVSLCDWVTVRHKDLGIDMKAQVVKTVYDTIAERYNKIELGSAKANFGDTIRQVANDLTKLVQSIDTAAISSQITREYQAAIQRATNWITGAEWGAVRHVRQSCCRHIRQKHQVLRRRPDSKRCRRSWQFIVSMVYGTCGDPFCVGRSDDVRRRRADDRHEPFKRDRHRLGFRNDCDAVSDGRKRPGCLERYDVRAGVSGELDGIGQNKYIRGGQRIGCCSQQQGLYIQPDIRDTGCHFLCVRGTGTGRG